MCQANMFQFRSQQKSLHTEPIKMCKANMFQFHSQSIPSNTSLRNDSNMHLPLTKFQIHQIWGANQIKVRTMTVKTPNLVNRGLQQYCLSLIAIGEKLWKVELEDDQSWRFKLCGGPFLQLQAGLPLATLWPNGFGYKSQDRLDYNTPSRLVHKLKSLC